MKPDALTNGCENGEPEDKMLKKIIKNISIINQNNLL